MIRKETRELIRAQIKTEIDFARRYKQGKIASWSRNEQMYYGKKEKTDDARANVALGRMQERERSSWSDAGVCPHFAIKGR